MKKGFQKCEPNEHGVLVSTYVCEADGCEQRIEICPPHSPVNEYPQYCVGPKCVSYTYPTEAGPHAPTIGRLSSQWSGAPDLDEPA